jgi:hypothetical protein
MISFVICGIEHSGTTLLSDLFRQIPGVDAGFECGVLLCPSPRAFPNSKPFFENMLKGWDIGEEALRACCETDEFPEFYDRLTKNSGLIAATGATRIFDKTPRYLSRLSVCLQRTSVPFLCTYKDPRAIVYSDMTRAKPSSFEAWYETYRVAKKKYLTNVFTELTSRAASRKDRALAVRLEDLCLNARETLERVFIHVGQRFSLDCLLIENKRYAHNRDNSINARIPFEYRLGLTRQQISRIETDFSSLPGLFYD